MRKSRQILICKKRTRKRHQILNAWQNSVCQAFSYSPHSHSLKRPGVQLVDKDMYKDTKNDRDMYKDTKNDKDMYKDTKNVYYLYTILKGIDIISPAGALVVIKV